MKLRALLLSLLLLPLPAGAETPVELSAQGSIAWQKSEKAYVAQGSAEAVRGDTRLNAGNLRAEYRETGTGGTEVYKVTATEQARFSSRGLSGRAGQILYRADSGRVEMTGPPLVLESDALHITASRSITLHESPRRADLAGDARILSKANGTVMTAQKMQAHFHAEADGTETLSEIHATGSVTLVSGETASLSDEATYNAKTDEAVLSGNVRITRRDSQLGGNRAIINLATGDSRILAADEPEGGRARVLFLPASGTPEPPTEETP